MAKDMISESRHDTAQPDQKAAQGHCRRHLSIITLFPMRLLDLASVCSFVCECNTGPTLESDWAFDLDMNIRDCPSYFGSFVHCFPSVLGSTRKHLDPNT